MKKRIVSVFLLFALLMTSLLCFYASAASGEIEVALNGIYYIQNIEYSNKYLQIDDNDGPNFSTEGQHMEIWAFNGDEEQQWAITYLPSIGYHKIISVKSGKALSVQPAYVNSADKELVQYSYDGSNTQLWKIYRSSTGGYIFRPKSGEGGSYDWCMCVGDYLFPVYDGRNVEQRKYKKNNSYKDEWKVALAGSFTDYRMSNLSFNLQKESGITDSTWLPLLENAVSSWNNAGVNISISLTSNSSVYKCNAGSYSTTWYGLTIPVYSNHSLTSAQILINKSTTPTYSNSRQSVIAHEIGHLFGLEDDPLVSDVNASLMNHGRNRETIYFPQSFDIDNIRFFYGN